MLFVSLASFFSAILNSNNKFGAAAAAPIILNIILILILFFGNYLNDELVIYLSYGVTFAGLVQLIFLIIYVKNFYIPKISFIFKIQKMLNYFLINFFQVYFHLE